jgi:hypothetical protein
VEQRLGLGREAMNKARMPHDKPKAMAKYGTSARVGMRSILFVAPRCHTRIVVSAALPVVLLLALVLGLAACTHVPPKRAPTDGLVPALEHLVRDTAAAAPQGPAVWLHVQAPRLGLDWRETT